MHRKLSILLLFLLASCAPAQSMTTLPLPTATVIATATTTTLPEATATITSIPPSPTTEPTKIPCDPHAVDYCITDGHFIFQRPVQPPNYASVDGTYRYASTANGTRDPHHGVEIGKDSGTPIHAAADGVIYFAGPDKEARFSPWANFYGNMIVIQHADGLFTLYGHLSKIDVQQGQAVTAGEKIGEMGHSGAATGSHLHFEVRHGAVENYFSTQNPELWLIPESDGHAYYGALMISIVNAASQYQFAKLTIARYPDSSTQPDFPYYLDTYVNTMAKGDENAAIGGLQAGRYRIAFELNGYLYERWVEVQSEKLTQTIIVVK